MDDSDQELTVLWFLTGAAVLIMLLRLGMQGYKRRTLELGDYITVGAIVALLLRGAVIHVALVWGTNSITAAARATIQFTPQEIYRREVGSKLTIVNRVFYTVYTWLQKCVVMCVLQRLFQGLKSPLVVASFWATLAVTFIVSFIMNFVECHPFQLYWQVVPNPGTCSKGTLQLIVFSVLNMATDIMLIALPLPQLIKIKRPLASKIRLIALFLVGLTIVAVTLTRLLMNLVLLNRAGQSHNVANVELFFEAFVANAPTIYGLLNIGKQQKGVYESHQHVSNGFSGSKSTNSEAPYEVTTQIKEVNHRQPSAKLGSGKTWYGNESDEEMMIELSESSSSKDFGTIKVKG